LSLDTPSTVITVHGGQRAHKSRNVRGRCDEIIENSVCVFFKVSNVTLGASEVVDDVERESTTVIDAEHGEADPESEEGKENVNDVVSNEDEVDHVEEDGDGGESDATESSLHPEDDGEEEPESEEGPSCPAWVAKKKVLFNPCSLELCFCASPLYVANSPFSHRSTFLS